MSRLSGHLKFTRDGAHGHKDKYWVADLERGTLSCYKNDSDAVAQFVVMAHQIVSVREEVDRQNKFFDFRLKTTAAKDGELSFRSQSKQDRDRWMQAINSLIANKKSSQLSRQFMQAVEGRCEDGAKRFGLKHGRVAYCGAAPLASLPQALWQTYIAAVEEALRVAEAVLTHETLVAYQCPLGEERGRQIVKAIRIFIVNGYHPAAPVSGHDNSTSTLTIAVTLLATHGAAPVPTPAAAASPVPTGANGGPSAGGGAGGGGGSGGGGSGPVGVAFEHEDAEAIVLMVHQSLDERSAVYTPEGSAAVASFRAMRDFLRPPEEEEGKQQINTNSNANNEGGGAPSTPTAPPRKPFALRYRYADGHAPEIYGGGTSFARRYLARHVNHALITWMFQGLDAVCSSASPSGGAARSHLFHDDPLLSPEGAMLDALTPADILNEMLEAVVIEIPLLQPRIGDREEAMLAQPPRLFAVRRHEEGRPELTLIRTRVALRRFRAALAPERSGRALSLAEQLAEIVLVVRIAAQCSIAEERINAASGCREPIIVDWPSLLSAAGRGLADAASAAEAAPSPSAAAGAASTTAIAQQQSAAQTALIAATTVGMGSAGAVLPAAEDLPLLVRAVGEAYAMRVAEAVNDLCAEPHVAAAAQQPSADGLVPSAAAPFGSLYEGGFLRCIAGSTLSFAAAPVGGGTSLAAVPAGGAAAGVPSNAAVANAAAATTRISRGLLSEVVCLSVGVTVANPNPTPTFGSATEEEAPRAVPLFIRNTNPTTASLPPLALHFSATSPSLGAWLVSYFAEHGTDTLAPQFGSDGVALDEAALIAAEAQQRLEAAKAAYMSQQEKVAIARSTENSALQMRDIARIVSDRQRQLLAAYGPHLPAPTDGEGGEASSLTAQLLASDATITAGVHALDRCFVKGGKAGVASPTNKAPQILKLIDKQDVVRILSVGLLRLRLLFAHVLATASPAGIGGATNADGTNISDGESPQQHHHVSPRRAPEDSNSSLSIPEAAKVLRDFCDFSQNEERVGASALLAFFRRRVSDDTIGLTDARLSFDDVAAVALEHLLPEETRLASLGRRDVLVIGLESAGKSTVINHIRHQSGRETLATIGIAETFVAHKEWVFAFKELGGRVDFRKNWREYFKTIGPATIHGVVVVVNAQDTKRFAEVREFVREVVTDRMCYGVPVLFVLNNHEEGDGAVAGGGQQPLVSPTDRPNGALVSSSSRSGGGFGGGRGERRGSRYYGHGHGGTSQPLALGGSVPAPRQGARRYTTDQVLRRLAPEDAADGHPHMAVFCNITHMSSDKAIDHRLGEGLAWFCGELRKNTPAAHRPQMPKTDMPAE